MIVKALGYLPLIAASGVFALGYMLFWMEALPVLIRTARLAVRVMRAVFLGIGWAVVIARLLL